jgi:hypothetical protein
MAARAEVALPQSCFGVRRKFFYVDVLDAAAVERLLLAPKARMRARSASPRPAAMANWQQRRPLESHAAAPPRPRPPAAGHWLGQLPTTARVPHRAAPPPQEALGDVLWLDASSATPALKFSFWCAPVGSGTATAAAAANAGAVIRMLASPRLRRRPAAMRRPCACGNVRSGAV